MAEPKFVPKPGQVDYTAIRYAPVVNTIVAHDSKVLLVQRSSDMRLYPGYWNGISGFLDDARSIEEKVAQEIAEELGILPNDIVSIERGSVLLQEAPEYHKTWFVVPVLARVTRADFTLDWEAVAAQWYTLAEIKELDVLPGFEMVIAQFLDVL
jgi:NADH pyrophosphatase NudC (nudix superfamily)